MTHFARHGSCKIRKLRNMKKEQKLPGISHSQWIIQYSIECKFGTWCIAFRSKAITCKKPFVKTVRSKTKELVLKKWEEKETNMCPFHSTSWRTQNAINWLMVQSVYLINVSLLLYGHRQPTCPLEKTSELGRILRVEFFFPHAYLEERNANQQIET